MLARRTAASVQPPFSCTSPLLMAFLSSPNNRGTSAGSERSFSLLPPPVPAVAAKLDPARKLAWAVVRSARTKGQEWREQCCKEAASASMHGLHSRENLFNQTNKNKQESLSLAGQASQQHLSLHAAVAGHHHRTIFTSITTVTHFARLEKVLSCTCRHMLALESNTCQKPQDNYTRSGCLSISTQGNTQQHFILKL